MALLNYLHQITYFPFIDLAYNNLQMILKANLPCKWKITILGRITGFSFHYYGEVSTLTLFLPFSPLTFQPLYFM